LPPEIVRLLQERSAQIPISSVEDKLPEEIMAMIQEHFSKEGLGGSEEASIKVDGGETHSPNTS
jgi:hypothetical protein